MRVIPVDNLKTSPRLHNALYHESGECLLQAGDALHAVDLRSLRGAGIESVYELELSDSVERFRIQRALRPVDLDDAPVDQPVTRPVYDDAGNLLLAVGTSLSTRMKENLRARGIWVLHFKQAPEELRVDQVEAFRRSRTSPSPASPPKAPPRSPEDEAARRVLEERIVRDPARSFTHDNIDRSLMEDLNQFKPTGVPLETRVRTAPGGIAGLDQAQERRYLDLHNDAVILAKQVFTHLRFNQNVNGELVGNLSRRIIDGLVDNRDMLLNLTNINVADEYLLQHSVNVAILSMNIATAMGYNAAQIEELGYGGFFHDIGMLRVPPEIINKPGPLSEEERLEVEKHPMHSIQLLQKIRNIPISTAFVAYQCHERLDKSGYLKGRPAHLIHDFAKIVAVADVYEALVGDRAYRKGSTPYQAMESVVRLGNKRKLDPAVIRALLKVMSLFPIGSWVQLSDGRIGKVVAANPDRIDRPLVNIVYDTNQRKIVTPELVDLADGSDRIRVVRDVSAEDLQATVFAGVQ